MPQPRTLLVSDPHNVAKTHAFRLYGDGHIAYDQLIYGERFYRRWARTNSRHGYRHLLPPPASR